MYFKYSWMMNSLLPNVISNPAKYWNKYIDLMCSFNFYAVNPMSLKSVLVLLAQILGPLGPPEVQPHPITIQNMTFGRLNFFWDRIPLSLKQASLMSDVTALDKIFNVAVWHWHSYLIKFGDMRLERMNNFAQIGHVAKLEVFRKFIPFGSLTSP